MKIDTIETSRLLLRPITLKDVEDFFKLDSNPNVHKYLGNTPVTTISQSKDAIVNILQQYKDNGIGRLAVIIKDTGEWIGWSGLKLETGLRPFKYYDIGYRFKEDYWGKGYATETAIASLRYGFEDLKLPEICAAAAIDNIGSNKILKSIGLKLKAPFYYDNQPHNWYALKRNDYMNTL